MYERSLAIYVKYSSYYFVLYLNMKIQMKLIISSLLGVFMGYVLPHLVFYTFFTTSAKSILIWGAVGFVLCLFALTRKESILMALAYMLFLVESFLFLGQLKFNSQLFLVLLFLLIMGIVALVCGLVMGLITYYIKKLVLKLLKK